jgi:hypothetical protein
VSDRHVVFVRGIGALERVLVEDSFQRIAIECFIVRQLEHQTERSALAVRRRVCTATSYRLDSGLTVR